MEVRRVARSMARGVARGVTRGVAKNLLRNGQERGLERKSLSGVSRGRAPVGSGDEAPRNWRENM